jgi:hypothetical protein
VEGEAKLEAHFKTTKVKDGEDGQAFDLFHVEPRGRPGRGR